MGNSVAKLVIGISCIVNPMMAFDGERIRRYTKEEVEEIERRKLHMIFGIMVQQFQQETTKTDPRMAIIHANIQYTYSSFDWVNFPHTNEYVTRGGPFDSRNISESYDWLRWIIDNYDDLPEYCVFLHGHKASWHTPPDFVHQLNEAKPEKVQMLGKQIWDMGYYYEENEIKGLNQLHQMLFLRDFFEVAEDTCLWTKTCCSEMVVSRKAIQQHPRLMYRKMIDLIEADPEQPWGWIFERSWENIFNYQSCK